MDFHPIFVHFPIAFLTVYSLMELIRFRKLSSKDFWIYTKSILLLIGFVGSLLAFQTGDWASYKFPIGTSERRIISIHKFWAGTTIYTYGFVLLLYLIFLFHSNKIIKSDSKLLSASSKIINSWIIVIPSLAGLAAVTITGALGGAIVYGPDIDPFVSVIYHLFF